MSKKNRGKEERALDSMSAEEAFCAVDNTKCDGRCRDKNMENGFVFCSETITEGQAISIKEKRKRGWAKKKRKFYKDYGDDDEYDYDD